MGRPSVPSARACVRTSGTTEMVCVHSTGTCCASVSPWAPFGLGSSFLALALGVPQAGFEGRDPVVVLALVTSVQTAEGHWPGGGGALLPLK